MPLAHAKVYGCVGFLKSLVVNKVSVLSKNPVINGRSKHIDVRFHFLRDLTKDGVVKLGHCASEDQLVDIMTKPLRLEVFMRLRELLGVCLASVVN